MHKREDVSGQNSLALVTGMGALSFTQGFCQSVQLTHPPAGQLPGKLSSPKAYAKSSAVTKFDDEGQTPCSIPSVANLNGSLTHAARLSWRDSFNLQQPLPQ